MRLLLAMSLLSLLLAPSPVGAEAPPSVTIRVVDLAEVGPGPLLVSLDVTQSLFDAVGITMNWRHCVDGVDDCSDPLRPHEVWLRVAPGNAKRDGWAGEWVSPRALGFLNIGQSPDSSVMSTIFVKQVARLAHAAGIDATDLLGHVAAHEVAHLILGTSGRTTSGLMGTHWSVRSSPEHLRFSSTIGSKLRAAIKERGKPECGEFSPLS